MQIPTIQRPPKALVKALAEIGTATIAGEISKIGIRNPFICGPVPFIRGKTIAGPALTLQFLPKREDVYDIDEYQDPEAQMHRQVLYQVEEGDVVVVDARGDMLSGVFGEMMLTYLKGRGGAGTVIDGCIRDCRKAEALDFPIWLRGVTPNYHTQTGIFPHAVNVPIACGGILVMPGDIVVADDDGAVVVPVSLAEQTIERATRHAEWEDFSRLRLSQGGDLRTYYPLSPAAQDEYLAWRRAEGGAAKQP
ncbi:ribonuclease activity regulator RraA [Pleomorphomonas carboxyditropha]|uniref:Putative 4-hydroxy-4-methyl-2-oxoglutarate aldolase n=1 Tax=Pleomorphomonas carboxyditropha TaxID=2023338 RepID=A0A2G9WTU0_9HYPH|nr:ribonuclease activity regulator RraA [Pleomorphomonas carboxyditropha]PIO98074.1 ribonuclease activity regulator RraA [Pleomorphomonas carboxyditropha]